MMSSVSLNGTTRFQAAVFKVVTSGILRFALCQKTPFNLKYKDFRLRGFIGHTIAWNLHFHI